MDRSELLDRVVREAGVSEDVAERLLGVVVEDLAAALKKRAEAPLLEVPPYFDRYVTTEIGHLRSQITHLQEDMAEGFEAVDKRFVELREDVDRRFDRLERWFFAMGIPIILGILAIIFKVFFVTGP
ncbi:MAG TPA: hypothetical protein EYP49_21765 [Anaerolineae bacterium]|nr:hypothetical protein [Anaerolineae bacterium]